LKLKQSATGSDEIKPEDRFYFEIEYPKQYDSTKIRTKAIWVHKSWTVGKAIDEICEVLSIENRNNDPTAKKLEMSSRRTSAHFPNDISLSLLYPELTNGDPIRLSYGTSVSA